MTASELDIYRKELESVLSSSEFRSSRQLKDFLTYISQAAFEGRNELDQSEIAHHVLRRSSNFNPVEDSSVRKLASVTRQKLEQYFANGGAADPIRIALPHRTYVPVYSLRPLEVKAPEAAQPEPEPEPQAKRRQVPWTLLAGASLLVLGAGFWIRSHGSDPASGRFEITAKPGDIMHETLDLGGDGIKLGPKVSDLADVEVRLLFTPTRAHQQAGIMIFENPDRYIKFGRHFTSRSQLEFGLETGARYQKGPGTFEYDPSGQNLLPLWLSIRRDHSRFQAFSSTDGLTWKRFGAALEMPDPMPNARVAIYAFTGRTEAPSIPAVFDNLSAGLSFHDWPDELMKNWTSSHWKLERRCEDLDGYTIKPESLEFFYGRRPGKNCGWELTHPAAGQDWRVSAKLDFLPSDGANAGLVLNGKQMLSLTRSDINGGSIVASISGQNGISKSDYPGNPPVILRLESKGGNILSSFSRDGVHFENIPLQLGQRDMGADLRFGLRASFNTWTGGETTQTARFYYIHQDVLATVNFR